MSTRFTPAPRECFMCRGTGGTDYICTECHGSGELPTVADDLADAVARITHLDRLMLERAEQEAVLDADVAGSLPWDVVTDGELDQIAVDCACELCTVEGDDAETFARVASL
mgnify:FL=1